MRKLLPVVTAIALALPATASAGTVSGLVTDQISGLGVPNVTVGIGVIPGGLTDYVDSAADGSYSFTNVSEAKHVVCFIPKPGANFLKRCWHDETVGFYGEQFDVPADGTVDHIDAGLAPGASITGTIVGWDGQPLVGACAVAWRGQSGGLGSAANALTDASGRYTITGLDPGIEHKVVFGPGTIVPFSGTSGWATCEGASDLPNLVDQWFDRKESYDTAASLTLTRSETIAGVDGILGTSATPPAEVAAKLRAKRCVVPKLRTKTFASARAALARAGCSTPMPVLRKAAGFKRGRVVKSRPAAHVKTKRRAQVKLVVSR